MRNGKSVLASIAGMFLISACLFGQTTATTTTYTRSSSLAPVGLAVGETVQINLVNTASATNGGTAASCTGFVSFYGAAGTILSTATGGTATSFTIGSGVISNVKLPYASAGASGSRTVVRPVITVTGTSGVPCSLDASLETFDTATGVTHTSKSVEAPEGGFGKR